MDDKLVELVTATPRPSDEETRSKALETLLEPMKTDDKAEETKATDTKVKGLDMMNGSANKQATVEDDNGMKTIDI